MSRDGGWGIHDLSRAGVSKRDPVKPCVLSHGRQRLRRAAALPAGSSHVAASASGDEEMGALSVAHTGGPIVDEPRGQLELRGVPGHGAAPAALPLPVLRRALKAAEVAAPAGVVASR